MNTYFHIEDDKIYHSKQEINFRYYTLYAIYGEGIMNVYSLIKRDQFYLPEEIGARCLWYRTPFDKK